MKLYRIRDWEDHFENNRTRELKKLQWVPIPNHQDGDGYTQVMEHKNGPALYGAWVACVAIASKCEPRGTLRRDRDNPHTPQSLARMSRVPARLIEEMLEFMSSDEIGWMEVVDSQGDMFNPAPSCENPAPSCDSGALKGREGKGRENAENEDVLIPETLKTEEFVRVWSEWRSFRIKMKSCKDWCTMWKKQLAQLSAYGPAGAVESMNQSMASGWQGLFPPKSTGPSGRHPAELNILNPDHP